jgi:trehalose-6-phosphatase
MEEQAFDFRRVSGPDPGGQWQRGATRHSEIHVAITVQQMFVIGAATSGKAAPCLLCASQNFKDETMFEKNQKLEISPEQLSVIESALHTQSKILNVQAAAGGAEAREKLNLVKRTLADIGQQRPAPNGKPKPAPWFGRLGFARCSE